ncbi:MAG: LptF/LptG family permease [Bacteroidota bacterium]|nr:LptF/LptG family permease [Bacteroidota bacterium]
MKIFDKYIIKSYLLTFLTMLSLFIPVAIMVDLAEKIDKFKEKEIPLDDIINYYYDFVWYFGNLLFPIFLFLAVIWFTSKLANNTEVIAILSSGISFFRFLRPYIISASIIAFFSFMAGMFIVPKSSLRFNQFRFKYIEKKDERRTTNLFKKINDNEYIFVSNYDPIRKRGTNFSLEHFKDNKLKFKILSNSIRWIEEEKNFRLFGYSKRFFDDDYEKHISRSRIDTIFDFKIEDLSPVTYKAETLTYSSLNKFIEKERLSGSVLINNHLLVRHKRWSLPLSSFVLTIIAVSVSSFKRRGGMGINLAFGICLGFVYIFFDKIFGIMVNKSTFSPAIAAWLPLFVFGLLSIYLLLKSKR